LFTDNYDFLTLSAGKIVAVPYAAYNNMHKNIIKPKSFFIHIIQKGQYCSPIVSEL